MTVSISLHAVSVPKLPAFLPNRVAPGPGSSSHCSYVAPTGGRQYQAIQRSLSLNAKGCFQVTGKYVNIVL